MSRSVFKFIGPNFEREIPVKAEDVDWGFGRAGSGLFSAPWTKEERDRQRNEADVLGKLLPHLDAGQQ